MDITSLEFLAIDSEPTAENIINIGQEDLVIYLDYQVLI